MMLLRFPLHIILGILLLAGTGAAAQVSSRPVEKLVTFKALPEDYRLAYREIIQTHPYCSYDINDVRHFPMQYRQFTDKDQLFYLICGLMFLLGCIHLAFGKYFYNLFRLVFRNSSFRQKQMREQLLQSPLASLLLNIFFVLAAGVYIILLLQHYNKVPPNGFWLLLGLSIATIAILYISKFILLKLIGLVFTIREPMETYSFIVFLINKIIGLTLLPLLIVIAFSNPGLQQSAITLSYLLIAILLIFRYLIAWNSIGKEVKVTRFHFFLYLCAFEIAPLLLIYRGLSEFI